MLVNKKNGGIKTEHSFSNSPNAWDLAIYSFVIILIAFRKNTKGKKTTKTKHTNNKIKIKTCKKFHQDHINFGQYE